jgi:hypothetical protein
VKQRICAAVVACAAAWGGIVQAALLVDSGTPTGPEDLPAGKVNKAVYYDAATSSGQFIAQPFTLPSGALITGIDTYFFAPPGVTIDVRLTTTIGAAATLGDQRAQFALTSTQFEPQFYASAPLSVGLPAGTYYLVYSTTSAAGAGFANWAPTDVGDLTFANTSNGAASHINTTYPPASGFFAETDEGDIGLHVHGVVPEPAGLAVVSFAIFAIFAISNRRLQR